MRMRIKMRRNAKGKRPDGFVDQVWGDALNGIAERLEQGKLRTYDDFSHAMRQAMGTEKPAESK